MNFNYRFKDKVSN